MPVGADPHGGQLTLSEEVAKVLAKLEEHGYFGIWSRTSRRWRKYWKLCWS